MLLDARLEGVVRILALHLVGDLVNAAQLVVGEAGLTGKGMGLRSNRYSMLVKNGKVASLNIEGPGKFEVSDAATMLAQAKA